MEFWSHFIPDDPSKIGRTVVAAVVAYAYLVVLIRVAGKRTVSQMNSFDWIVTMAIGSLTATAMLSSQDFLVALVAMAVIVGLQAALTWLTLRYDVVSKVLKAEPTLLVREGQFLRSAMRKTRVNEDEILAAIRNKGLGDVGEVKALILESDGTFSVLSDEIATPTHRPNSTLRNLDGLDLAS